MVEIIFQHDCVVRMCYLVVASISNHESLNQLNQNLSEQFWLNGYSIIADCMKSTWILNNTKLLWKLIIFRNQNIEKNYFNTIYEQ